MQGGEQMGAGADRPVRAVVVDVGETLVDRTAEYAAWADRLGIARHTFSAVFGAVIADGAGVRDVLARFGVAAGAPDPSGPPVGEPDLYPGARAALAALRSAGLVVGVAGNQPAHVGDQLRALDLPVDWVVVSAELGASKPDPRFFAALVERAGCEPGELCYVGDQLDADVRGALDSGLQVVRVRTGPWGHLLTDPVLEARCRAVLASIADLPGAVS